MAYQIYCECATAAEDGAGRCHRALTPESARLVYYVPASLRSTAEAAGTRRGLWQSVLVDETHAVAGYMPESYWYAPHDAEERGALEFRRREDEGARRGPADYAE